jgi:hypothetical protein
MFDYPDFNLGHWEGQLTLDPDLNVGDLPFQDEIDKYMIDLWGQWEKEHWLDLVFGSY